MINNSKILTVSYGTFSCTLEGFDDSFGTMKAIAEYFRDLAADDRYFGAEPPTPDADMLARIAEREISRRVEAREDDGKIVLRAGEAATTSLLGVDDAAESDATSVAAEEEAARVAAEEEAARVAAEEEAARVAAEEEAARVAAEEEAARVAADEEAARVAADEEAARVAADEEAARVAAEEEAARVAAEEEAARVAAEEEAARVAADEEAARAAADSTGSAPSDALEVIDITEESYNPDEGHEADKTDAEDVADASEGSVDHPDPDSVAAKLRRIRSVVAQTGGGDLVDDYSEDEHAQDFLSATVADLDSALAEDDAVELSHAPETVSPEIVEAEAEAVESETPEDISEDVAEDPAEDGESDVYSLLAQVSAQSDEDDAEEMPDAQVFDGEALADKGDDNFEDTLAQLMADAMPEADTSGKAPEELTAEDSGAEDDAERPQNARVVKMKRSEFEAAVAAGEFDEETTADNDHENLFGEEDTIAGEEDGFDGTLSPEEEAELQRELAEVEAEFTPEPADAPEVIELQSDPEPEEAEFGTEDLEDDMPEQAEADAEVVAEEEAEEESEFAPEMDGEDASFEEESPEKGAEKLQRVGETSDVSRIFEEADHQLEEPDSSKRRSAIQHLRAAVAATRAERKAGIDLQPDVDETPYRTDLADVVRPRRPHADGTARSERPGQDRPAPLKLVAEQRIDTPHKPIRPRRVTAAEESAQSVSDDGSFTEFADEMGANSLPELLEAAAAFMADVEGRPQFSRPMLMGKLKEVEGDEFSREDGLRSFGQLLRQGKLQKLKGGRFAVTDETDFRVPQRNAG